MKHMSVEYFRFAQHYLEMFDTWAEHHLKVHELKELGEPVPEELQNEVFRHRFIVTILEDSALKLYGKNHNELYEDACFSISANYYKLGAKLND